MSSPVPYTVDVPRNTLVEESHPSIMPSQTTSQPKTSSQSKFTEYWRNYISKLVYLCKPKPVSISKPVDKATIPLNDLSTIGPSQDVTSSHLGNATPSVSAPVEVLKKPCCDAQQTKDLFIHAVCSFIVAFIGMLVVAVIQYEVIFKYYEDQQTLPLAFVAFSMGATSVLIYDAIESPLAQPRNVLGGHLISAILGVCVRLAIFDTPLVATPLSVALAIAAMRLTGTTHPPGGATALVAATYPTLPKDARAFIFVALPMLGGSIAMLIVAWLFNNLIPKRTYPKQWW